MRKAVISSIKDGMATVVYGSGEASNPMPVLAVSDNMSLKPGDRVAVAPLEGKRDGIVIGTYRIKTDKQE
ncbi:MAG: hypothetical protein NC293_09730 [Roseburia sp.]|nr:hypothetical protein [Roseburia sp.]